MIYFVGLGLQRTPIRRIQAARVRGRGCERMTAAVDPKLGSGFMVKGMRKYVCVCMYIYIYVYVYIYIYMCRKIHTIAIMILMN